MIYERDYIKRLIRDIARGIAKLLLGIDTETPSVELLEDSERKQLAFGLLEMLDSGDINGAENLLWESLEDDPPQGLETGLIFYSHLNEKSDAFLEAHDFTREEVEEGLRRLAGRYGIAELLPEKSFS